MRRNDVVTRQTLLRKGITSLHDGIRQITRYAKEWRRLRDGLNEFFGQNCRLDARVMYFVTDGVPYDRACSTRDLTRTSTLLVLARRVLTTRVSLTLACQVTCERYCTSFIVAFVLSAYRIYPELWSVQETCYISLIPRFSLSSSFMYAICIGHVHTLMMCSVSTVWHGHGMAIWWTPNVSSVSESRPGSPPLTFKHA